MGMEFNFSELEKNLSDEVISNKILTYAGIDTDNVPILIEDAIRYFGFQIGVVERFKRDEILLGIAHAEEKFEPLKSNKYVIFNQYYNYNKRTGKLFKLILNERYCLEPPTITLPEVEKYEEVNIETYDIENITNMWYREYFYLFFHKTKKAELLETLGFFYAY